MTLKHFVICLLLSQFSFTKTSQALVVERVLAIVADEIITLSDLKEYRQKLKSKGLRDETLLGLRDSKRLLEDNDYLVNHLIDERILDSQIKKKGLSVTIERVEQEIRRISQRNGMNRSQLKQSLASQGVSLSLYQDFLKRTLERQALIEQEVSSRVKVSDDDILSYLVTREGKTNLRNYQFKLSHILFRKSKDGAKAALARAQAAKGRVRAENFKSLVEQLTEDPNFTEGGLLGTFNQNEMNSSIRKAVLGIEEGEITGVVETPAGYHIIRVDQKNLVSNPELDARKEDVRRKLFGEGFKKQLLSYLESQRRKLFIRVN